MIFHIFTKSSDKVAITHLYIEQLVKLKYVTVYKKVDDNIFEGNCVAAILLKVIIKN